MSKRKQSSDMRIVSLKGQNSEYNEIYRKWRIDHKDNFGFYFSGTDELTWRAGEGFVTEYPEAGERSAVRAVTSIVAQTLIIFTVLDIFCVIFFHDRVIFGRYADYDPHGYFAGDESFALILSYGVNILRRLLPQVYLFARLRMPLKIVMPMKVSNKPLFTAAIPVSLLTFGIISLMSGVGIKLFSFISIDMENSVWIPQSSWALVLSSFLYTVIIPVISEIIHRGVFMQTLRQFGDGYALMVTSLIAAFTVSDAHSFMFTFGYSLIIGYCSVRSGSILTAIIMRIVLSANVYWFTFFRMVTNTSDTFLLISYTVLAVYIVVGLAFLIRLMLRNSTRISLPMFSMYVSQKEKLLTLVSDPYVLVWFSISVLGGLIGVLIR